MPPRKSSTTTNKPSLATILSSGFDVSMPCSAEAAKDGSGYTKGDVHAFAKALGITVGRKGADCLCQELRDLMVANDQGSALLLRNTERNEAPGPQMLSLQPLYTLVPAALSPAPTPMPLGSMAAANLK
jgi:hypothetical protein